MTSRILGIVSGTVARTCSRCDTEVPSVQVRYIRHHSVHAVDEGVTYQPEPHQGPCGNRCENGWGDWRLGQAVHRGRGCRFCPGQEAESEREVFP